MEPQIQSSVEDCSRRRMRLPDFDYGRAGAYFVTICTEGHRCSFGEIVKGEIRLGREGESVRRCWGEIPAHFPGVVLDGFVIMPNHVHGILLFTEERAGHARPLQVVVGSFKSAVSREIGKSVWQRSYWERVIRSEDELNHVRRYIEDNPLRWSP